MTTRKSRAAFALAVLLFAGVGAFGFASLPTGRDNAQPLLALVVVLVLAPLSTGANAAEYVLTGRYVGVQVRLRDGWRVAVLSTAANLLPLPGAALVRAAALRRAGTGSIRAGRAVGAAGVLWLAATAALAGLVELVEGERATVGICLIAVGGLGSVAAHRLAGAHRLANGVRTTSLLIVVEAAAVVIGAARLWVCSRVLGFDLSADQAVVLTSASVLASAAGLAPGGLGIRELLAAAIAPAVGGPAAVGAASSALDRVLGLAVVGVAAAYLVIGRPAAEEVRR